MCPFCYMGETMLEKTLDAMALSEPVEIVYKAYELDPEAPEEPRETMTDHFMAGHDISREQAERRMAGISKMAARVGLHYNLAEVKVCNSLDAHRMMKYAASRLSAEQLKQLNFSIFKANFEENELISSHELLADLAAKVGLDRDGVLEMLKGDDYTEAVRADEQEIESRADFEYIPFMLLGNGSVIQGVLHEPELKQHIEAALSASAPTNVTRPGCGPSGCTL